MRSPHLVAIFITVGAAACRNTEKPAGPPEASVETEAGAPRSTSVPATATECVEDNDCEVLTIEVAGPYTCCPSCSTTAGTRAWAAGVKARCVGATGSNCYPLACPMGPTQPRCDAGRCIAVPQR